MESSDEEDQRKPAALTPALLAQAAEASSDDESISQTHTEPHSTTSVLPTALITQEDPHAQDPPTQQTTPLVSPHPAPTLQNGFIAALCQQYRQTDSGTTASELAMDMILFTHHATQAQTLESLLLSLATQYGTEPPDPGFFLCQSHGHLVILYGITQCSQKGSKWHQQTLAFVGDLPVQMDHPPITILPEDLGSSLTGVVELRALANLTSIRQMAKNAAQSLIAPRWTAGKSPQRYRAINLVKLPPAVLQMALSAGDPQATPISFILPIVELVKQWTTHHATLFPQAASTINIGDTLKVLGNSLKALVTAPVAEGHSHMTPRETGSLAMNYQLRITPHAPDVRSTSWIIKHLRHATGLLADKRVEVPQVHPIVAEHPPHTDPTQGTTTLPIPQQGGQPSHSQTLTTVAHHEGPTRPVTALGATLPHTNLVTHQPLLPQGQTQAHHEGLNRPVTALGATLPGTYLGTNQTLGPQTQPHLGQLPPALVAHHEGLTWPGTVLGATKPTTDVVQPQQLPLELAHHEGRKRPVTAMEAAHHGQIDVITKKPLSMGVLEGKSQESRTTRTQALLSRSRVV